MSPAHRRPGHFRRRRLVLVTLAGLVVVGVGGGWALDVLGRGSPTSAHTSGANLATGPWRAAWALSLSHSGELDGTDRTCRLIAKVGLTGSQVRLRLVNYPATGTITFSHVTVGVRLHDYSVDPQRLRDVTFAGAQDITLQPGASVMTDPVALPVRDGEDLAVSVAVSSGTSAPWHYWTSQKSACTATGLGDQASDPSGVTFDERTEDRWLDQVQVLTSAGPEVPLVAVYGDSISDGIYLPFDTGSRWTDRLEDETDGRVVVLNYGVSGDRITGHAPLGELPPRLNSDVLAPSGIGAVVVEMGSNDVRSGISAQKVLQTYAVVARAVEAAHATLIVATVPPRSDHMTAAEEKQRQLLNAGLRRYPIVADIDKALSDPKKARLNPRFDIGDSIHPNAAGVAIMTQVMRDALRRVPGAVGAAVG
jgi:lysophospholipase L1-like esterase